MNELKVLESIDKKMSAILALIIHDKYSISNKTGERLIKKVEVLLLEAELKPSEIAKLLNKKVSAVQKTLQRARKK